MPPRLHFSRRLHCTFLLTLFLLAIGSMASAQAIFETFDSGSVSFDWNQWPFGYPTGSVSAAGPVWNDDLTFPGGAGEGCGGGIVGSYNDTTQALAIGGIINPDGTYDAVAVFVTFPEGPAVGSYEVDAESYTVGFVWIDNVSNLTIPDQDDDLIGWFEGLEADNRYGSASGTINVTAVSADGFAGTFTGLLGDPGSFTLLNVENGQFAVENLVAAPVLSVDGLARLSAAPNPFNPQTTIALSLDRSEQVQVAVYDMAGRKVATVHEGYLEDGDHRWVWSGRSDANRSMSAGMYLCRAVGKGWHRNMKLVLVP